MNPSIKRIHLIAASLLLATAAESVVKEPEVRQEKIELAAKLLAKKPVLLGEEMIELAGNPFKAEEKPVIVVEEEVVEVVVEEEIPAAELIPLLAENVNPTGIFSIGGECYLMFKEDKVKSGEVVPVMYKNKEYNLEITNVLRNGYNLRFQDAELEIKLK